MIESVYKKIHPATGIIRILIDTKEKWVSYQPQKEEGRIGISFFIPSNAPLDDIEKLEWIEMEADFNPFDYMVYSSQEKDQITLMFIPKALMLNREEWQDYESKNSVSQ